MPETSRRTREQVRAACAHELISQIKVGPEAAAKTFGRQCLRLPALIHQCGLCQTLAFLAKDFGHVVDGLAQVISAAESKKLTGADFAKHAREASMLEYQWLTREALKSSQWLKRYAEAILKVKQTDESKNPGGSGQ